MHLGTTGSVRATSGAIIVPKDSRARSEDKKVKVESGFLKLGLFSLRRQGVQLNLGIFAGTVLALVFTVLVYLAFQNVDAESGLSTWRNILLAVGVLATTVGVLTNLEGADDGRTCDRNGGLDQTDGTRRSRLQSGIGR